MSNDARGKPTIKVTVKVAVNEEKPKASEEEGKTMEKEGKVAEKEGREKTVEVKEKKKRHKREILATGEKVHNTTSYTTWKILSLLGSGGFGDVYRVTKEGDTQEYALKTEQAAGERSMLRLKVEAEAMFACNKAKDKKHFVELVDRGKVEKFKFIVMTLVGANLDCCRKKMGDFSLSTSMQVAIQTMEAIRDFHQAGWLHRDIKPHNFAHGLGDKASLIYLLDFGIARRIHDKQGKIKVQRTFVKYLGTLRYASRRCHKCLEQGRKDDVETWIYMIFDVFDRRGLPWRKERDRKSVISQKEQFFQKSHKEAFYTYYEMYCPVLKEFWLIVDNVRGLNYEDEPAYNQIIDHLVVTAKKKKIDLQQPLDWTVKKEAAESEKKDAGEAEKKEEAAAKPEGTVDEDAQLQFSGSYIK